MSIIAYALYWSYSNLNDVELCNDTGDFCMKFAGWIQFTTFTRWCWICEGVYFVAANCMHFSLVSPRFVQMLFGVSLASAFVVTTVTYGVLVPGALLRPQPIHRRGSITLLLSPAGHAMHSFNTIFILFDMWLSRQSMQPADMFLGVCWGSAYVVFEWVFHHYTHAWHYPFLNYNLPYAWAAYGALFLVFAGYWVLGCEVSAPKPDMQESEKRRA